VKHLRILVIEDEFLVALDMTAALEHMGYGAVSHAETESSALQQLTENDWDAVIADANLNGCGIEKIGVLLQVRNIPFVIVTGYERENLPAFIRDAPMLSKPVSFESLAQTVRRLCKL
jgi:DNA-binding NarL/FixJ family response regulator